MACQEKITKILDQIGFFGHNTLNAPVLNSQTKDPQQIQNQLIQAMIQQGIDPNELMRQQDTSDS